MGKKELIEEMKSLHKEHEFKKDVIRKILDDLDNSSEITENHIKSIDTINEIMKEMDIIEQKSIDIENKIKNK